MTTQTFAFAAVLIAAVWQGDAFPEGPPASTCLTLYPKHQANIQTGTPPFQIHLSAATYTPGQNITVEIVNATSGRTFKGFQITASRDASSGNSEQLIGTFTTSDDNTTKSISCLGEQKKMLGHSTNIVRSSVKGIWTAPSQNVGNVVFHVTVVENYTTIWYNIKATLQTQDGNTIVPPNNIIPAVTPQSRLPDWSECQKSKGCFLHPEPGKTSCSGDDCLAAVSYRQHGDLFTFEMTAAGQDNYVAVGFSADRTMADDQVVICTAIPGRQTVQLSYNPVATRKTTTRQYSTGLQNLTTTQQNGRVYCTFTCKSVLVSITSNDSQRKFDLSTEKYYLFLAWGPLYKDTVVVDKHTGVPAISSTQLDLKDVRSTSGSSGTVTASKHSITWALLASSICFTLRMVLKF